jgi:putative cell wall-binding protein
MHITASGGGPVGGVPPARMQDGGPVPLLADGTVLVGYGEGGALLGRLRTGEAMIAVTSVRDEQGTTITSWGDAVEGLAGGPLIVRAGAMTPRSTWELEGFSDSSHSAPAGPRTAVGATPDDATLLVTVDGRQTGYSEGMTMAQLAQFLIDLGADRAVALDGGGSTQITQDAILRNRPCSARDSCGALRPVGTGLVIHHDYDYVATTRLAGSGREATAAAVARAAHPQGAGQVVLASAGTFPDALAGGPLAASLGAPLLLTGPTALAPVTREAITALGARTLTLLGGSSAISPSLERDLRDQGFTVRRISGPSRIETAAAIAEAVEGDGSRAFLASAGGFADALSSAAPAGILRAPVLLTGRGELAPAAAAALAELAPDEVVIVGGLTAISASVEQDIARLLPDVVITRLSGEDRFGTARAINEWAVEQIPELNLGELVVARGDAFPDALAGGPLAASRRSLLMIVTGADIRRASQAAAYLDGRGDGPLAHVTLLGGFGALSSYQQWQLDQLAR